MFDFVYFVLPIISIVPTLAFTGLLVLLCIRTRSKGLIIITAVLVFRATIGSIPSVVMEPYLDQWQSGDLNNWLTQRVTIGEFMSLYTYGRRIFYNGLLVLGAFLIYREWSSGKISWLRHKSSEIVNHA